MHGGRAEHIARSGAVGRGGEEGQIRSTTELDKRRN
jgi:hypothetical protein